MGGGIYFVCAVSGVGVIPCLERQGLVLLQGVQVPVCSGAP